MKDRGKAKRKAKEKKKEPSKRTTPQVLFYKRYELESSRGHRTPFKQEPAEPSQELLLRDCDMPKTGPGDVAGLKQATGSCRCHAPGRSLVRASRPSGGHSWVTVLIPNTEHSVPNDLTCLRAIPQKSSLFHSSKNTEDGFLCPCL